MRLARPATIWFTILSLALLGACGQRDNSLLYLVPRDSYAVIVLDWRSVRSDDNLRSLVRGGRIESALERLGIEDRLLTRAVVFARRGSEVGFLFQGFLNERDQINRLQLNGWKKEAVDGYTAYFRADECVIFPAANTVFIGAREDATAVFSAVKNQRDSFSSSISFKRIDGLARQKSDPVRAFLVIPEDTLAMTNAAQVVLSMLDLTSLASVLKTLTVAKGAAVSLKPKSGQMYALEICAQMRDQQKATEIVGAVKELGALSDLSSDQTSIQHVKVAQDKEVLSVTMDVRRGSS